MSMQCSGCKRYFSGLAFFDKHRKPTPTNGKCLDPADITLLNGEPAMELRPGKFGSLEVEVWGGPEATDAEKERFASMRLPAVSTTKEQPPE